MNRPVIIGLGAAGVLAVVIVIGLASASGDSAGEPGERPLAAVSPTATRPAVPIEPTAVSPGRTPAPAQPTAIAPVAGTPLPDSPVQSTPPGGGPVRVSPMTPPPSGNFPLAPAPIERVDILMLESFPVQYVVHVVAGLPSGCARPHSHDVETQGRVIRVRVLNQIEGDICTAIYGTYELNINLGSAFQSGIEYMIWVNERSYTLRAQ